MELSSAISKSWNTQLIKNVKMQTPKERKREIDVVENLEIEIAKKRFK